MVIIRFLLCCCVCLLSVGCFDHKPPPPNFVGLSGKANPAAEMNYSKARILWSHRPEKTSVLETCSDPHKAIALLTDAIMLDAKYADAYMRRGLAKSELGRMDDAYEDATAALRLQPTAENYAYRAMVFLRAKKFTAAQKDLNVSFRGNEEQHLAWTVQGSLHLATNATSAACEDFEKACSYGNCMPLEYLQKDDLCK